MPKRLKIALPVAVLVGIVCAACGPIARHEVFSTIIDGCPSLPSPQQLCEDYAAKAVASQRAEAEGKKNVPGEAVKGSQHLPYIEKRCDDCHDKSKESGFVVDSKKKLCFVCHTDFIKGAFVHGPAAVGDCLACHEPHTSQHPSLLKTGPGDICATCHREKRQAAALHETVAGHNMICTNCHDPHFGNVQYFLK